MSWDGIYRAKTHYRPIVDGRKALLTACKRRAARNTTPKKSYTSITCFACLKTLGMIK